MKLILIAAALAATPALAQTTTPTDSSGMNGTASGQTDPSAAGSQPPAGQMQSGTTGGQSQPGTTPMGGYQPSGSALSGPATPGAPVTYQQAPSPDQAYPAPAAMAHYPPCKPGQYDNCTQVSGSHGAKHKKMVAHKAVHRSTPMKKATTTKTSTTTTTSSQ